MYQREIPHLPIKISRQQFVDEIFVVGMDCGYGCDSIMTAVDVADYFVSYEESRTPYTGWQFGQQTKKENYLKYNFMNEVVPQVYSRELVYVIISVISMANEDSNNNISNWVYHLSNAFMYKMQWEVCMLLNFTIKIDNFMSNISNCIWSLRDTNTIKDSEGNIMWNSRSDPVAVNSIVYDIGKLICSNDKLLQINRATILVGILLLHKYNKLKATYDYKSRKFLIMMKAISSECEIPLSTVVQSYIRIKKELNNSYPSIGINQEQISNRDDEVHNSLE